MNPIRVTGSSPRELDARELESLRRDLTPRKEGVPPVCSAPWTQLVFDAGGEAWACRAAATPLAKRKFATVEKAWSARTLQKLRTAFEQGELDGDHCRACVHSIELGLTEQAALVRDHESPTRRLEAGVAPARLVLRLDRRPSRTKDAQVLARVADALEHLDELELEAEDVLSHDLAWKLMEAVAELPADRRPAIALHTGRAPSTAELRTRSLPVRARRIVLTAGAVLEQDLVWARENVGPDGALTVLYVFGGETWFELPRVAALCDVFDAELDARITDESGVAPILSLPLDQQRVAQGYLGMSGQRFGRADAPRSFGASDYDALTRELRQRIERQAAARQYQDPGRALAGDGAVLRLPPVEHPALADAELGGTLVNWIAGLEGSTVVADWADAHAESDEMAQALVDRPWVRLLLQKGVLDGAGEAAAEALRETYRLAGARKERLAEERALGEQSGATWAVSMWHRHFGFDNIKRRRPPFKVPTGEASDAEAAADPADARVTVLIPSFRHETYIEECVRSALAQTDSNVRVLVVDDRSPDETVARARRVEDPRLEVRVNEANLGLGNSVLAALETIETPYVALLNSDDLFHPDRVSACCRVLDEDGDAQLVTTALHLVDQHGGELTPSNASRLIDGGNVFDWVHWYESARPESMAPEELFGELLQHNFLATSSNLVCRTDFLRSEAEALRSLKFCLDWHLFLAASLTGGMRYLPDRLAAYRLHPNNTVWFDREDRWVYFLEVNRVAASNLSRMVATTIDRAGPDAARQQGIRLIVDRLAQNTEVTGLGLLACEMLDGFELDRIVGESEVAQAGVRALQQFATRATRLRYAADSVPDGELARWIRRAQSGESLQVARVLADLRADQSNYWRGSAQWARRRLDHVERRLDQAERRLTEIDAVEASLREVVQALAHSLDPIPELGFEGGEVVGRLRSVIAGLRRAVDSAVGTLQDLRDRVLAVEAERQKFAHASEELEKALQSANEQKEAFERRIEGLTHELEAERDRFAKSEADLRERLDRQTAAATSLEAQLQATRTELQQRSADLTATQQALSKTQGDLTATRGELATTRTALAATEDRANKRAQRISFLEGELGSARRDRDAARGERDALAGSREYRIGFWIWRKLPFFAKSRRFARRVYRGAKELVVRTGLAARRALRGKDDPVLRVGAFSTSRFPVLWHTFVYQELTCMRSMLPAEVRVHHTEAGPREDLHAAFADLADHSVLITPHWETNRADFEHYRKTRADRVESLIAALSAETGIAAKDLEKHHAFLIGFTYARRMEAWGADYVHSYFFYDQALCGLVAHWLLGVPRGVSAYADHMLNDYALKAVPLHLRTAAVIVATSARIRDELLEIGGPEIAERIVVKPNGVDGARFNHVRREAPASGPLELLCVARIEPKKGLLELVECVDLLRQRGCHVRIHLIGSVDPMSPGSADYGALFTKRIEERGLGDRFVLHGAMMHDAMREHFDRAHGFIAPFVETEGGDKDGIPTAILEAFASGLPVVGTNAGSIPEVIDSAVEGYIVPQRDPVALADAVQTWFDAPELIRSMSDAAHARFEREFDTRVLEPQLHERIRAAVDATRAVARAD